MSRDRLTQLIAAAFIAGVVVMILVQPDPVVIDEARAAEPAADATTRPATRVQVVHPTRDTITRVVRLAAEVKPYRDTSVFARATGYASSDPLEVGTRVDPLGKDGERVLLELDTPALDAAVHSTRQEVARAEAAIAEAKAAQAESKQAKAKAEAQHRQAVGTIQAAEAQAQKARAKFTFRTIVIERLTAVLADSPNLVAQDRVDEARGNVEIARAEVSLADVGIEGAKDDAKVAEAQVHAAAARILAADAAQKAAVAQRDLAEARMKEAQTIQGFGTLTAPFTGVVAERMVDRGDLVQDAARNSGARPLFRIVDDNRLRIRFFLSTPDAPYCRIGNTVEVLVAELADDGFTGVVARVADALDPETRTMEVEAELENPRDAEGRRLLRADMFARAKVQLETYENALVLPARCVTTKKRKSSVLVVTPEGIVRKIPVKIGVDDGIRIQILDGVDESAQVISRGGGLVADGEKAVAVPAEEQ